MMAVDARLGSTPTLGEARPLFDSGITVSVRGDNYAVSSDGHAWSECHAEMELVGERAPADRKCSRKSAADRPRQREIVSRNEAVITSGKFKNEIGGESGSRAFGFSALSGLPLRIANACRSST
jgi:hypothetical protein